MPWPNGSAEPAWKRCHFMNCEATKIGRIEIVTPDRGTVPRAVCEEHRTLIADAVRAGLPIMVTPTSVYGAATVQGGTVWINTITDFWFGTRRPYA